MKEQREKEIEIIKRYGGDNIEEYCLVNNTGYTFYINNIKFDARHWRNVYGTECNFFDIHKVSDNELNNSIKELIESIKKELNENIGY